MPIAGFKPNSQHKTKPELPKTAPDDYKGVVVDDKYHALHSLTRYVEGYPLTITYYGQILGENNDPREVDPAQSGVYQSYIQIKNLDIRVDKPLEMDYNSDSGLSVIVGSANIYPDITPNTYDYFTTVTTRGKLALFRITDVTRMSMNRDSVHKVDYQMVGYTDVTGNAQTSWNSLLAKVKKVYFFSGDRLAEGSNPLLKEDEHNSIDELFRDYNRIVDYYFTTFMNRTHQTLVLPGQPGAVYDKFLTDYILKIVSVQDHEVIQMVKKLGSDQDRYMEQPQFWRAIYDRNPLFICQANKYMGLTDRRQFVRDTYIAGAGLSTIDKYVYPLQTDTSVAIPGDPYPKPSMPGLQETVGPNGNICSKGTNTFTSATGDVIIYKRVLCDLYYVLSRDFYDNEDNWSLLEKVTWDYLNGNACQLNELTALTKQYYSLSRLEQFYYGPLLMTFIKDTRYAQYTER